MKAPLLQKIVEFLQQRNTRERRLLAVTLAVAAASVVYSIGVAAYSRVQQMEQTITRLHDDLVNYQQQLARMRSVEAQYEHVAVQHSSEWTEAEIHDRLRQEIYRLAQTEPPALGPDGVPVTTATDSGTLIDVPGLQPGTLRESGAGYREYVITLRIPDARPEAFWEFLQRLLESPQSLRIDALEINRDPLSSRLSASVTITRTVVDTSAIRGTDGKNEWVTQTWQGEGCTVTPSREIPGAWLAQAQQGNARAFQTRTFFPDTTYDLVVEVSTQFPTQLAIMDDASHKPFSDPVDLKQDGKLYRYRVRFTTPDSDKDIRLLAPALQFAQADSKAVIRRVFIRPVMEQSQ